MSTAIMSRFDFGENLMKPSVVSSRDAGTGAHLDLGSAGMRFTLTRMASTPAAGAASNLTLLLGNLTQQHRRLERAQSAPAPAQNAALAAAAVNTSRYKTELCRPYEEFGVCKYGDKCQFAHGGAELRSLARHPKYKTELCRTYHTVGFCPYGPRCHFVHNQDEVLMQQKQAMARGRNRPAALSPTLSLDSASPPCSLSQSPTSSMGSFFSSEPELSSPASAGPADERLPVFNRLMQPPKVPTTPQHQQTFVGLRDLVL